jgi:hypothetical protein
MESQTVPLAMMREIASIQLMALWEPATPTISGVCMQRAASHDSGCVMEIMTAQTVPMNMTVLPATQKK